MTKKYDTIKLNVVKIDRELHWLDFNCCQILLNGEDLLDIITKAEEPYFESKDGTPGLYTYMTPSELYEELNSIGTKNKKRAHVLCCTCGEVGCASTSVQVLKTDKSIIWKNFKTINDWTYDLSFEFTHDEYNHFIKSLEEVNNTLDIIWMEGNGFGFPASKEVFDKWLEERHKKDK